jgi:cytochrome b561
MQQVPTTVDGIPIYSPTARFFHWSIVVLLVITVPVALVMGAEGLVSEATQNTLYDTHKLIGFLLLALVIARLVYRLRSGAPQPDQSIQLWQHALSGVVHWTMYGLLLLVPILGYIALQYYGPIVLFNKLPVPGFVVADEKLTRLTSISAGSNVRKNMSAVDVFAVPSPPTMQMAFFCLCMCMQL